MKKILSTILIASAALASMTSCSNEMDDIFDKSAAERLNATQVKYSNLLTASPHGWAFEFYPTKSADDGAVLYALRFDKNGSVEVAGYNSTFNAVGTDVSLWDIIADNGPTLTFNSYNELIHMFSDPYNDGEGYGGDYEFCFVYDKDENPDSVISLRGKKRGLKSRLKMIDEDVTLKDYLLDCVNKRKETFPDAQKNYNVLRFGDNIFRLDNMSSETPQYYPFGKDATFYAKTNSYILAKYNGNYILRFNKEFLNSDSTKSEKDFIYDAAQSAFVGTNGYGKITCPDMATFLGQGMVQEEIKSLKLSQTSKMSSSFSAIYNDMLNAFKAKGYTIGESVLSTDRATDNANCTLTLRYKPKTGAYVTQYFTYNMELQGDKVVISYVAPLTTAGETILKNIPECETFIKAFAGSYTVENPADMKLCITEVSLTDGDKSFTMPITYPADKMNNQQ